MSEVIERRIRRSIENDKGGFGSLPDMIFVDRRNYADTSSFDCMRKM